MLTTHEFDDGFIIEISNGSDHPRFASCHLILVDLSRGTAVPTLVFSM
jgi:hypothetical protein